MRVAALLLVAAAFAATTVTDARGKSKKAMKTKRAKALDRPIPPSAGFDAVKGQADFADKLTDRELKEHLRSLVARYDGDEARVQELLESVLDDDEAAKDLLPIKSTEDKFDAKYIILGAGPGGACCSTPHAALLLSDRRFNRRLRLHRHPAWLLHGAGQDGLPDP